MRRINLNENVIGYDDVANQWFRSMSEDSSEWINRWIGYTENWVGYFDVVRDSMIVNDKTANFGIQMIFEI